MNWDGILTTGKLAFAGGASALTYVLGDFDTPFKALILFMVVDYITGIMVAIYNKEVSSEVGLSGIIKKVMQLFLVAVAFTVDNISGFEPFIRNTVIYFLLANEGISILENASATGVYVPPFLRDAVDKLKESSIKKKQINKKSPRSSQGL